MWPLIYEHVLNQFNKFLSVGLKCRDINVFIFVLKEKVNWETVNVSDLKTQLFSDFLVLSMSFFGSNVLLIYVLMILCSWHQLAVSSNS